MSIFMVFHATRLVFHGSRLVSKVFHGSRWVVKFCHGSRSVFHGYRLDFHSSKSVLHGFLWFQVNSYGFYSSELDFYVSM